MWASQARSYPLARHLSLTVIWVHFSEIPRAQCRDRIHKYVLGTRDWEQELVAKGHKDSVRGGKKF